MSKVDFSNKEKALTVLSSGDHVFNLLNYGIYNIDAFDTNRLTEYYVFGIKQALILKYNYFEFLTVLRKLLNSISLDEEMEILTSLLPFMDKKYREFWNQIINYNYIIQKNYEIKFNLFRMLFINIDTPENITKCNSYLSSKERYDIVKENINKTNISFRCIDALNLGEKINKKFDIVILSNIIDYFYKKMEYGWEYEKLNDYISSLNSITKLDSIIFLNYIHKYQSNKYMREILIKGSNIKKNQLEEAEIITVSNINTESVNDGVIVLKK